MAFMSAEVKLRLIEKMERELGDKIIELLNDDDVIEVMLNDDGHIWIVKFSEPHAIDTDIVMPVERSLAFIGTVASYYNKTIHSSDTIVDGILPIDGSRFNGVIPPTTREPSFNIRKKAKKIYTLDDYINHGRMTETDKNIICEAVRNRENIILAGATGSGKTTFTNAILHEINRIHPMHRIITMEDQEELQIPQKNKVRLFTDDNTSMQKLLFATMRKSPDRIIIGEVRNGAALDLLKSWNTGHPGGVTTVHANSCLEALTRLEMLILEAIPHPMPRLIGQSVGLILFIAKTIAGPTLTEIAEVIGYNAEKEEYELEWLKKDNKLIKVA
jgi:type IV secretion system protein VirB11